MNAWNACMESTRVDRSIDRASIDVFLFLCPKCTYDTYTGVFHTHYVFRRKVGKGHAHARKSDRVHSIEPSIDRSKKEAKGAKGATGRRRGSARRFECIEWIE